MDEMYGTYGLLENTEENLDIVAETFLTSVLELIEIDSSKINCIKEHLYNIVETCYFNCSTDSSVKRFGGAYQKLLASLRENDIKYKERWKA